MPLDIKSTTLSLDSLTIPVELGSDAWGREKKSQPIVVSIRLKLLEAPRATRTDEVDDTFSYSGIQKTVSSLGGGRFETLKDVANVIAETSRTENWPLQAMRIELRAPQAILHVHKGLELVCHVITDGQKRYDWAILGLRASCIVGVNPHERLAKQELLIDLSPKTSDNFIPPWMSIASLMLDLVEQSTFQTVEALAYCIGEAMLSLYPKILELGVKIDKPNAYAWAEAVGCEIVMARGSKDTSEEEAEKEQEEDDDDDDDDNDEKDNDKAAA